MVLGSPTGLEHCSYRHRRVRALFRGFGPKKKIIFIKKKFVGWKGTRAELDRHFKGKDPNFLLLPIHRATDIHNKLQTFRFLLRSSKFRFLKTKILGFTSKCLLKHSLCLVISAWVMHDKILHPPFLDKGGGGLC